MTTKLENSKTYVVYNPTEKRLRISGRDKTDHYNDPSFYSTSVRGIEKGWAALVAAWNENVGMYEAMRILGEHGIKTHSYCAMD